jgi:methyl-accepting chemotaxis protein
VVIVGLLLAVTLGPVIYLSITSPIKSISGVVERVSRGDLDARTDLESKDEIGQLGNAFDSMLNERVSTMATAEVENEKLNNSVIGLLEAVSNLSERDLTVSVPVAEDVTGPVADAMNLMTSETARVLSDIRKVASQVVESASMVQNQGGRVTELAASERAIVEDTMEKLNEASKSMTQVAQLARACNETAAKASESTQVALETVSKTATGMGDIRETIAETEKRIKRLGERSQEINGVVEIINNIAERTHVLALNASMQAAAAGDAGRGFAVVADEVQRLAESSRQATSEIASLVGNIQSETAETMATMNKTISQVVEGTELAQAAGGQMEATQKTTAELAHAVEQISKRSLMQVQVSTNLSDLAAQVQASTQETSVELEQQSGQTIKLVEFSRQLVDSVSVFKLPQLS